MTLGSFYFKSKAKVALKGNWQTALVVTFFAGIITTILSTLSAVSIPDITMYTTYGQIEQYLVEIQKVSSGIWIAYAVLNVLSFVCTPALLLGSNHYFIERLRGNDLEVNALASRANIWLKALWLHVIMFVRTFLWSLLFIVPGVIAAIRYSMAPYYLAQDPTMTAMEAIEKSKNSMANMKMSYFSLLISFVGWSLLAMVVQTMLISMSTIIALVAAQFMQLMIATYQNAAIASFYITISSENGVSIAHREVRSKMQEMGVDTSTFPDLDQKSDGDGEDEDE
ncbi:MAG: DUF975 family protein [Clostridiales bacterium]|nr:DUF975 family protein [Clostridiales bacterium]